MLMTEHAMLRTEFSVQEMMVAGLKEDASEDGAGPRWPACLGGGRISLRWQR